MLMLRAGLLLCGLAASAHAGCVHTGQSLNLDEDTFDAEVVKADHLLTFVEFSSPWCIWAHPNKNGHGDCATMRKAWDRLAKKYNDSPIVRIAEVDCSRFVHHPPDENGTFMSRESLCQRYSIQSYPTVKLFTGATGEAGTPYDGDQTYKSMKRFLDTESTKLCLVSEDESHVPTSPCNEQEKGFINEWRVKAPEEAERELARLEKISSSREVDFGARKREWMGMRINILKQFRAVRRPKEPEPPEAKTEL